MNIWFFSAHDQPKGRSSRTYDFSKELVKLGHKVTMFTNSICHWTQEDCLSPDEKWRFEYHDGIKVVWLKTIKYNGNGLKRGLNMISNARRAFQASAVLKDRPDVVVGPSVPIGTGWAAQKIAERKRAAFVYEVRDVWPIALVDNGGMSKFSPIYFAFRYIEKTLYRKSFKISSTVPLLYDHVKNSGGDPNKIIWLPNGVDFSRFQGFDKYQGGTSKKLVVMYVGGFGAAHDVISIVRAATLLQKKGNEQFYFVIVGDGVNKAKCEHEAAYHKLINIEFRGSVLKSDVPKIQMEADILIASVKNSAIYRFGLNLNKLYDYFASSRPVIFSGKAENDPVIASKAGFTIEPENPEKMVEALLKFSKMSPVERIEMGKRGRVYVEKEFNMKNLGKRMEKMLFQAVSEKESKYGY